MVSPNSLVVEIFSVKHLVNTLITLFTAGADTSTSTLSYFILYMAKNPDIMRKVQDEIDRVVGSERQPSLADRAK